MRKRGGEQHVESLFGRREPAQDVADVGNEAQIEHAVGLVEHENLYRAQVDDALLDEIDDPARSADQDVHPLFEMVTLLLVVDAAEGETEREPRMRAENFGVAMDLNRQLARWCDDQRTRSVEIARNRSRFANQPCVHRDEK